MRNYLGDWINGRFQALSAGDVIQRFNPAAQSQLVFEAPYDLAHVHKAVDSARRAFRAWDRLGLEKRREYVLALDQVFQRRKEELAVAIATEAGKPLWEARGEAGALSAKISIMAHEGLSYTERVQPDGLAGEFRPRPLGVVAVLGPFNFPLHLPNGHIIPALLLGNTVVVKPSEYTPGCMQLYFECVEEAGFPAGVINMVQGPGEIGKALVAHPDVHGIFFTGSYQTGRRIKEAILDMPHKLAALEMGGKNSSIILDDADVEQAALEILSAAYQTTGQRCSATSRVIIAEKLYDDFVDVFSALTRRVTTGDPLGEDVFMGPLIDARARRSFLGAQEDHEGGKLTPIIKGGMARQDLDGHFVSCGLWAAHEVDPLGSHQAEEIFGPDVVLYQAEGDSQAARIANATPYGLSMSVFTSDQDRFEELAYDLRAGIVNLNRSTAGASSRLPFGGLKQSGNYRPAAVLAGHYCSYPQARLWQAHGALPDRSSAPYSTLRA